MQHAVQRATPLQVYALKIEYEEGGMEKAQLLPAEVAKALDFFNALEIPHRGGKLMPKLVTYAYR